MSEVIWRSMTMSKERGANPKAWRTMQRRRQRVWGLVFGVVILGGAVLGAVLAYRIVNRTSSVEMAQKAIVGKWMNSQGGELDFHADGSGYIPPTLGIEAYTFSYYFQDATHLVMNLAGQTMTVEITLVDDKLTWFAADPNVKYEYTRAK
jgi:hypothetical protein